MKSQRPSCSQREHVSFFMCLCNVENSKLLIRINWVPRLPMPSSRFPHWVGCFSVSAEGLSSDSIRHQRRASWLKRGKISFAPIALLLWIVSTFLERSAQRLKVIPSESEENSSHSDRNSPKSSLFDIKVTEVIRASLSTRVYLAIISGCRNRLSICYKHLSIIFISISKGAIFLLAFRFRFPVRDEKKKIVHAKFGGKSHQSSAGENNFLLSFIFSVRDSATLESQLIECGMETTSRTDPVPFH